MSEWQPIETAPKDCWSLMHGSGMAFMDCSFIGSWEDGRWVEIYNGFEARPTHWMPLPPAPDAMLAARREEG